MNTLFIDTTANSLVVSAVNPTPCLPPVLTVGDTVSLQVAFLQRNPQPLNTGYPIYNYLDFSAQDMVFNLGGVANPPAAGTFSLSFASVATAQLPFNLSAADMSVALNGLSTIISAGGVTVSGPIGGPFYVRFITNGVRAAIVQASSALWPAANASITTSIAGTTTNPAVQVITIFQSVVQQVSSWTAQASAAVTVTQLSANLIQRVAIPAGTYGGTFTLTYNGATTVAIPYACQLDLMESVLNALAGITGATVIPGQNYWDISIPGGSHTLTGSAAGLLIPLTLTGTLDLTPQPVADLLQGNPSTQVPFSIQTTASNVQTVLTGLLTLQQS